MLYAKNTMLHVANKTPYTLAEGTGAFSRLDFDIDPMLQRKKRTTATKLGSSRKIIDITVNATADRKLTACAARQKTNRPRDSAE